MDAWVAQYVMGLKPGVDFGIVDKHDWKKNEDGSIDIWAMDGDRCNGPSCIRCGLSYCQHCEPDWLESSLKQPCSVPALGYSEYMHVAWDLYLNIAQSGWIIERGDPNVCGFAIYDCSISYEDAIPMVEADTMPLAICRCALLIVL
jgi:hypothetical protein